MNKVTKKITRRVKLKIPKALRQQVWIQNCGKKFEKECYIHWCKNKINVFNFHCGHNIPESKGGKMNIDNLKPICASCNLSMGDRYTIDQWQRLSGNRYFCNIL